VVVSYIQWCLIRWTPNHFIPKLTNSKQDFLEITAYSLNTPPPILVNNSKTLIVPNHMKEHGYLLFDTAMYAVSK
jgi:hypothetical protein